MALAAIDVHDLVVGIIILMIGIVLYAFHRSFPPVASTIGAIAGVILAVIGIIVIILAILLPTAI